MLQLTAQEFQAVRTALSKFAFEQVAPIVQFLDQKFFEQNPEVLKQLQEQAAAAQMNQANQPASEPKTSNLRVVEAAE